MTIVLQEKKQNRGRKFEIRWYTAVFFLLVLLTGYDLLTAVTLGSALLHELGHLGAAGLLRVPVEGMILYPFGAEIRLGATLRSYWKDMLVTAAGSAVNWLLAWIGGRLGGVPGDCLAAANLVLGTVNLLPISGLDGGILCYSLLCLLTDARRAAVAARCISFFSLFLFWLAAVYILLVADGDPSLLFLVCALFASVFLRQRDHGRLQGKRE